jgi:hypothetical protein
MTAVGSDVIAAEGEVGQHKAKSFEGAGLYGGEKNKIILFPYSWAC